MDERRELAHRSSLDIFNHPYIYRDFSTVDVEDRRLVTHA